MKSKRRKIFYVALSILIAATIWFYVNNKESVTVYVHDVRSNFSTRTRRLPTRASCASVGTRISPSI